MRARTILTAVFIPLNTVPAVAMQRAGALGSSNVHIASHLPLGRRFTVTDIEIEQELSRPFAYVARMHGTTHSAGVTIIDLKDPDAASVLYSWVIENPELHRGFGAMDNKYFKVNGRYYDVQSFQWLQGGPNADLLAVVFDVTGLPDPSAVKEVGRIRSPGIPGGSHNIYAYKHSTGRALLFMTTQSAYAHVYDLERFLSGARNYGLIGYMPSPDSVFSVGRYGRAYHDFYIGYDPASRQDKFYGAGYAGFYVYDVTRPEAPELLTSIVGAAGVDHAHTFTPMPDGRYAIGESEDQYQPLRVFDLKPGLDEEVRNITRPIGAWTARWQGLPHNHEVRWPYVFVSGYEDGLHIFNMMDPTAPYTVGYYETYGGPYQRGWGGVDNPEGGDGVANGAFGIDVRNADGLIVISDMYTGFWAFRMDGFEGWNGHQWGMPNVSSAQDWDKGPDGGPAPVS